MTTLYDKDGNPHEFRDELVHEVMLTGAYTKVKKYISKSVAAKSVKKSDKD